MLKRFWNWLTGKKSLGTSLYGIKIYKEAKRCPATPKGGYYDFGKEVFNCPNGWSPVYPKGVNPDTVWVSLAVFEIKGDQGRDDKATWSKLIRA